MKNPKRGDKVLVYGCTNLPHPLNREGENIFVFCYGDDAIVTSVLSSTSVIVKFSKSDREIASLLKGLSTEVHNKQLKKIKK